MIIKNDSLHNILIINLAPKSSANIKMLVACQYHSADKKCLKDLVKKYVFWLCVKLRSKAKEKSWKGVADNRTLLRTKKTEKSFLVVVNF